ncbi:hypothetical protein SCA6_010351 [Theobroma cacao]
MKANGNLAESNLFPRLWKPILVQLELTMERMWMLIWRWMMLHLKTNEERALQDTFLSVKNKIHPGVFSVYYQSAGAVELLYFVGKMALCYNLFD